MQGNLDAPFVDKDIFVHGGVDFCVLEKGSQENVNVVVDVVAVGSLHFDHNGIIDKVVVYGSNV